MFGLNGALETLVPQAVGAGALAKCDLYLYRGRILILICTIPIIAIILSSKLILVSFGLDPSVAEYAELYMIISFPNMVIVGLFDA